MNLFSLVSLIVSIVCAMLALFMLWQARNPTQRIGAVFNINVAMWCLELFFVGNAHSAQEATFFWRMSFLPNTFISVFLFHLIYSFCHLKEKAFLVFAYLQGIVFIFIILFAKTFLGEPHFISHSLYFPKATSLIFLWLVSFSVITGFSFYKILQFIKTAEADKRVEALYLFWGMFIGFAGGFTIALPMYNIVAFYPVGHGLICIYAGILSFAVLRHNFFDLRVVLVRLLIPLSILAAASFLFFFIYFDMNLFTAASISLAISCSFLAYMILAYAFNKMHYVWAVFNMAVAVWGYGAFFIGRCTDPQLAVILWRIAFVGVIFISVLFYHFICLFCQIDRPKIIRLAYAQGIFFLLLNTTDLYISKVFLLRNSFYYLKATGIFFSISFSIWLLLVVAGLIELTIHFKKFESLKRTQALYVFFGFGLGFLGGTTNFFPMFGIHIFPFGNLTIPLYCIIVSYAILRYQLIDIKIAITRVGVFVAVYTLLLGLPFWLGVKFLGRGVWMIPAGACAALASAGPFVFFYIQRKVEDALLEEERRVQEFLRKASVGMMAVRDLQRLLPLIVHILAKNLRLHYTAIYLLESNRGVYALKASEPGQASREFVDEHDPLVRLLKKKRHPVVYEEKKLLVDNVRSSEEDLDRIVARMAEMSADVVIPMVAESVLLGFIVLGERKVRYEYSPEFIDVLTIVGNQAALAVENALFYEETGKDLAQRFHESRLKALGTLGTGIAHQMHNRFNVITFGGETLLRAVNALDVETLPKEEVKKVLGMVVRNVEKMVNSGFRGAEITDAIKNYARKADARPSVVSFEKIVRNSLELLYVKQHHFRFKFIEDYPRDVFLWANFSNLQEVIFNAADNSCDAMALKMKLCVDGELNVPGYEPTLTIRGRISGRQFTFIIEDNGMGFPEERLKKGVDVPFFTTKGAGKGTGMGIHMMAHYIKQSQGDLKIESEYGKYAQMVIALPLAGDEQVAQTRQEGNGDDVVST